MDVVWGITILSLATRFHNLSVPDYVCWDETHFGKMAGHYLNQTYFVDVHPPLGKILIAISGFLTGYDGQFSFLNPGDEYVTDQFQVHYLGMRAFCAILGSLTIPLLFCTIKELTGNQQAALISSALLVFDCGLLTISQYILLDPILLFFMSATIYFKSKCSMKLDFYKTFSKAHMRNFIKPAWCSDKLLCGVCLGCMVAVKWTGLFTVAFIGVWTLHDISKMKRNNASVMLMVHHLLSDTVFLVLVPSCIYLLTFIVHYQILRKSGGASDGFHSSLFQSCLKGNALHNALMPHHVAYGSIISLKFHQPSQSGLLHSNDLLYPVDITPHPQQQTTVYFHKDAYNFWEVVYPTDVELKYYFGESTDAVLLDHRKATCTNDSRVTSHAVWNVEQHSHRKLDRLPITPCRMTFWARFVESHLAMASFHFHFTKNSYNETSSPWHWPINYKGQPFTNSNEDDFRVYLLGNPLVFYINLWSLAVTFILSVCRHLKLHPKNVLLSKCKNYLSKVYPQYSVPSLSLLHFHCCELFFVAWALHYLPFLVLPRLVYFHHYYPAMLCNCCLSGCFYNLVFKGAAIRLSQSCVFKISVCTLKHLLLSVFVLSMLASFSLYSPLAYGVTGHMSDHEDSIMHGLKLFNSWNF